MLAGKLCDSPTQQRSPHRIRLPPAAAAACTLAVVPGFIIKLFLNLHARSSHGACLGKTWVSAQLNVWPTPHAGDSKGGLSCLVQQH